MIFRVLRLLWPFRRRLAKPHKIPKKVIAGLIIGSAIASIVGKKLVDKHRTSEDDE